MLPNPKKTLKTKLVKPLLNPLNSQTKVIKTIKKPQSSQLKITPLIPKQTLQPICGNIKPRLISKPRPLGTKKQGRPQRTGRPRRRTQRLLRRHRWSCLS